MLILPIATQARHPVLGMTPTRLRGHPEHQQRTWVDTSPLPVKRWAPRLGGASWCGVFPGTHVRALNPSGHNRHVLPAHPRSSRCTAESRLAPGVLSQLTVNNGKKSCPAGHLFLSSKYTLLSASACSRRNEQSGVRPSGLERPACPVAGKGFCSAAECAELLASLWCSLRGVLSADPRARCAHDSRLGRALL